MYTSELYHLSAPNKIVVFDIKNKHGLGFLEHLIAYGGLGPGFNPQHEER